MSLSFFLPMVSIGDPKEGEGYAAMLPKFGPFLPFFACCALRTR